MQNQNQIISRRALIISVVVHLLILLFFLFYAFRHKISFPSRATHKETFTKIFFEPSQPMPKSTIMPKHTMPIPQQPPIQKPEPQKYIPVALRPNTTSSNASEKKPTQTEPVQVTPEQVKPEQVSPKQVTPEQVSEVKSKEVEGKKSKFVEKAKQPVIKELTNKDKSGALRGHTKTLSLNPNELKRAAMANLLKQKPLTKKVHTKKPLISSIKSSIESLQGNSTIYREGENRMPSLEDMKYICYEQEIERCVVRTWNTYFEHRARFLSIAKSPAVNVPILNEDGKIINQISIISSSGNREFDKLWLQCVLKTQFPPIPKHLGVKTYTVQGGCVCMDGAN
jgi:outer membrane biosynthesis protein TonB